MARLKPNEVELRGSWELVSNSMKADATSERIESLVSSYLVKVGEDESAWEILYQDPEDKRYWELSYLNSEAHGGGAPLLKNLSSQEANEKYTISH